MFAKFRVNAVVYNLAQARRILLPPVLDIETCTNSRTGERNVSSLRISYKISSCVRERERQARGIVLLEVSVVKLILHHRITPCNPSPSRQVIGMSLLKVSIIKVSFWTQKGKTGVRYNPPWSIGCKIDFPSADRAVQPLLPLPDIDQSGPRGRPMRDRGAPAKPSHADHVTLWEGKSFIQLILTCR